MRILISLLLSLCLSIGSYGQDLQFGITGGLIGYSGDLDAPKLSTNLQNMKATGGIFVRNIITDRFSLRGNLMIGSILGDDALSGRDWQVERNLNFTSRLVEVAALLELNIFNFGDEGKRWTPYLAAGGAYFHHNPRTDYNGQSIDLQPLGTEGQGISGDFPEPYSLNLFTVPVGGGVKYKLNDKITLQGEILSRFTFNDYLDDVSGSYVNYFELLNANGQLAAELGLRQVDRDIAREIETGSQRGSADVNDYYYSGTISVIFNIGTMSGGKGDGEGCYQF